MYPADLVVEFQEKLGDHLCPRLSNVIPAYEKVVVYIRLLHILPVNDCKRANP